VFAAFVAAINIKSHCTATIRTFPFLFLKKQESIQFQFTVSSVTLRQFMPVSEPAVTGMCFYQFLFDNSARELLTIKTVIQFFKGIAAYPDFAIPFAFSYLFFIRSATMTCFAE